MTRECPRHDGIVHLPTVDYDLIGPGCVLPTGTLTPDCTAPAGAVVTAVEVYGPEEHPLQELQRTPPRGYAVVLYRTNSHRTYEVWVPLERLKQVKVQTG